MIEDRRQELENVKQESQLNEIESIRAEIVKAKELNVGYNRNNDKYEKFIPPRKLQNLRDRNNVKNSFYRDIVLPVIIEDEEIKLEAEIIKKDEKAKIKAEIIKKDESIAVNSDHLKSES